MLKYLNENPNKFDKAFNVLPMKLQGLFIQAYQSYLFNRFLSERIKADIPLNKAEIGDFIVGVERTGLPMINMSQTVTTQNQTKANEALTTGKMRLALPIVGFKQKPSNGPMGEIEQHILQQENMTIDQFHVTLNPKLSNRGSLRTALTPVQNLKPLNITKNNSEVSASLEFTLFRGCYATILLREIIKPQNLITAGF